MEALRGHAWPGNVRELANIVERLTILHTGERVGAAEAVRVLEGAAPRSAVAAPTTDPDLRLSERIDQFERKLIVEALELADGNVADAARRLRTDRANLYRRMRRLDIPR
jgi:two-component system, NtrC family, nitrogen regulation response regulator NtrX